MILSKVRDYFRGAIAAIDSDLDEWTEPFDGEEIPETLSDNTYWIKYDVVSSVEMQTDVNETINVDIKFHFKAFRDGLNAYDDAMDFVNSVRIKALSSSYLEAFKITDGNPIYKVSSISQIGEFLETNEKQIIITATFECDIIQARCN